MAIRRRETTDKRAVPALDLSVFSATPAGDREATLGQLLIDLGAVLADVGGLLQQ